MIKAHRFTKKISIVFFIILGSSIAIPYTFPSYGAEQVGSIQVNVFFSYGQRLPVYGIVLDVFQDSNQTAMRVITPSSFPVNIDSLPMGHNYKIDVYRLGMYASSGYIDLVNPLEKTDIPIPLDGGITFDVFYNDGETPIEGVNVSLKSPDGKEWAQGTTDDQGRTYKFWLQTSNRFGDAYHASFTIADGLTYPYNQKIPIFLGSTEYKIVTSWPPVIGNVLFSIYEPSMQKINPSDGNFFVTLNDDNGTQILKSDVIHGDATFTKIHVGKYSFHVIKVDQNHNATDIGSMNVILDGKQTQFGFTLQNSDDPIPVYLRNGNVVYSQENSAIAAGNRESCQCVIFRLDGIQDSFLQSSTTGVLNLFMSKDKKLTADIITNHTGKNPIIVNTIREGLKKGLFSLALNGHEHVDYTTLDHFTQYQSLSDAQNKMKQLFGNTSDVFVPPYNQFDQVTTEIMPKVGLDIISADMSTDSDRYHYSPRNNWNSSSVYYIPQLTESPEPSTGEEYYFSSVSPEQILKDIDSSLKHFGYAVITLHPQDFAKHYENGSYSPDISAVNATQLQALAGLLDTLAAKNIGINSLDEIARVPQKVYTVLGNSSLGVPDDPSVTNIFTFGKVPAGVAVNPNTNMIYVTNSKSDTISVIDGSTHTPVDSIQVKHIPVGVSVNPNTNMIYVINSYDGSISAINGSSLTVSDISNIQTLPFAVAINSNTNMVYAIDPYKSEVDAIDGDTNKITNAVQAGSSPLRIAVNSNTNMIYVTDSKLPVVSVIDGSQYKVVKTIPLTSNNTAVAITVNPTTNMVYVTDSKLPVVSVIDGSQYKVVKTIPLGNGTSPLDITANTATNTIYTTEPSGEVVVINGTTNTILQKIELGNDSVPIGIAVNDKTNTTYVANSNSNTLSMISEILTGMH